MFPFDVILFDVGGVLLTDGWDTPQRALAARHFNLDWDTLETRHRATGGAWERDEIDHTAYLDSVIFNEQRTFSHDEFFQFMLAQSQPLKDGALGILEELAASNKCLLGTLNNEARETNEYRFQTYGLRRYLQVVFSSCYLRMRKPDPAIYQCALDILGRPTERILFIDDRPKNVAGAEAAGIRAIHFEGEAALRQQLASLGVL
jgi:putative hydrolase of the HAD superfamily